MYNFQSYHNTTLLQWAYLLEHHKGHLVRYQNHWRLETNPYVVYEQLENPHHIDMSLLFKVRQEQLQALYTHLALSNPLKGVAEYAWFLSDDQEYMILSFKDKILGEWRIDEEYQLSIAHTSHSFNSHHKHDSVFVKTRMTQWQLLIEHIRQYILPPWSYSRYEQIRLIGQYTPAQWVTLLNDIQTWSDEEKSMWPNMDFHDVFLKKQPYKEIVLFHE